MAKSKITRDLESLRKRQMELKKMIDDSRAELKDVSKQLIALEKEDAAARRDEFAKAFESALRKEDVPLALSREMALEAAKLYVAAHPEEVVKKEEPAEDETADGKATDETAGSEPGKLS